MDHTGELSGTCETVLPEGSAPTATHCLQLRPWQRDHQMAIPHDLHQVRAARGGHKKFIDCDPKLGDKYDYV